VCSSDDSRLHCIRFTNIRGTATAFPSEGGATVWR